MTLYTPAPQRALGRSGPADQVLRTGSNTSTEVIQCSGRNSFVHLTLMDEFPPGINNNDKIFEINNNIPK